ncbi:hypothetical protein ACP4OV_025826 [Aristida adscensionis]
MMLLLCFGVASAAHQELIHLHFYFHEVNAGTPNATAVNVAGLHKALGFVVDASLDGSGGFASAINFVFSDYGELSGSTLAIQGRFAFSGASERSIVGGTGKLRFARGYVTSRLVSSTDTGFAVGFDMYYTLAH